MAALFMANSPSTPANNADSETFSPQELSDRYRRLDDTVRELISLIREQPNALGGSNSTTSSSQTANDGHRAGMSVMPGEGGSNAHPATAPTFLHGSQAPSLSQTPVGPQQIAMNLGSAIFTSHLSTPLDANAAQAVLISSAVPPVPGYIVSKIFARGFVDFILLRPCNLKKLPPSEPVQGQLGRLMQVDLLPIYSFQDWAEAWAVYTGVFLSKYRDQAKEMLAHFLLISSAARDFKGFGWRDYDAAFRKFAAENPQARWGEILPTLWITTTILAKNNWNTFPLQHANKQSKSKTTSPKYQCRFKNFDPLPTLQF